MTPITCFVLVDDCTLAWCWVRLVVQYIGHNIVCNGTPTQSYLVSANGAAARVRVRHSASVLRCVRASRVPVLRPHNVWPRGARPRSAASSIPHRLPSVSNALFARRSRHTCFADPHSVIGAEGARSARLVFRAVGRPSGARLRALLCVASRALVGCRRPHRRRASQRQENQLTLMALCSFFNLFISFHYSIM